MLPQDLGAQRGLLALAFTSCSHREPD